MVEKKHKVVVKTFGRINSGFANKLKSRILFLLNQLCPDDKIIDLNIFETEKMMNNHLQQEGNLFAKISGFRYTEVGSTFSSTHSAFSGYPEISFCFEKILKRPKEEVWVGELEHEVGHAILHGEVFFYYLTPSFELIELSQLKGINRNIFNLFYYLVSISVKDFEVSRFLKENDIVENQIEMYLYHLGISDEEIVVWKTIKGEIQTIFNSMNIFKVLAAATPFLYENRIWRKYHENLKLIPQNIREIFWNILTENFARLGKDTISNIETATKDLMTMMF